MNSEAATLVKKIEAINVQPDDLVIVTIKEKLTKATQERVGRNIRMLFGNSVRVVINDVDMEFEVFRKV